MSNFEKELHEFTDEELQKKLNNWDPRYGALAALELQRRLQQKNAAEVSTLVRQIDLLSEIVDKSAKALTVNAITSARVAKIAIYVAVASLITQVIFSTHQETQCRMKAELPTRVEYIDCNWVLDLGLIGTYPVLKPDYSVPK